MEKSRYIMIGGFLGAGKSTSLLKIARILSHNYKVGLITNDQGASLVDTATFVANGFNVEEIAGGCFCCRFDSLMDAAQKLEENNKPDIFLAEPVGSCTDLIATVSYPLRRIYGEQFAISPLSVVVDPIRAMRILELRQGKKFSPKVTYIYLKQLEEASIIVINKTDLLELGEVAQLRQEVERRFPQAQVIECSAREEQGVEEWVKIVMSQELGTATPMEVDYKVYAEGEALLGWLNASFTVTAQALFDGNQFLQQIAQDIQQQLQALDIETAHLKMTFSPQNDDGQIGIVNLVRNDYVPEVSQKLIDLVEKGNLIINVRAEGKAETLHEKVNAVLSQYQQEHNVAITETHKEFFQPSEPVPTHREKA